MKDFKRFTIELSKEIAKYPKVSRKELLEHQSKQMHRLLNLEKEFKKILLKSQKGKSAYYSFCNYVANIKKNLLHARIYFRERQEQFTDISKYIKNKDFNKLKKYGINYHFIKFIVIDGKYGPRSPLSKILEEVKQAREELAITNMPLIISRSQLFFRKIPKNHITLMDIIQIGIEGLYAAIDKYVVPPGGFSAIFRSVVLGRATGEWIEAVGTTMLRFYPVEKRKLYNYNKIIRFYKDGGEPDFELLSKVLNESGKLGDIKVEANDLSRLVKAASTVSADSRPKSDDEEGLTVKEKYVAVEDENENPEVIVERRELNRELDNKIKELSIFEQKFLALKGIDLTNV